MYIPHTFIKEYYYTYITNQQISTDKTYFIIYYDKIYFIIYYDKTYFIDINYDKTFYQCSLRYYLKDDTH
jgi:hypothetical protein